MAMKNPLKMIQLCAGTRAAPSKYGSLGGWDRPDFLSLSRCQATERWNRVRYRLRR